MSLDRVPAGKDLPNDCNVVIEIPMHADPIKYEVDKETGAVFVDRFMSTAMHYPCNYGYIPQTLSDDGDPCDVLVLSPVPLMPGVVVRCRPIGMLKMDDEAGGDARSWRCRSTSCRRCTATCNRRATSPRSSRADRAFLRALQGPRAGEVGARRELGRSGPGAERDHGERRALPEAPTQEEMTGAPFTATFGDFELSDAPDRLDVDVIHRFLAGTYWSPGIPRETVERAVASSLNFGLYKGDAQVGFARFVTDRATFAYLADVFVLPDYRGQGLATWLVDTAMTHPALTGLRRVLLATRDQHALYARVGFAPLARPERFMEILAANVYRQPSG